jgi:ubiquinone biosynthesis protein
MREARLERIRAELDDLELIRRSAHQHPDDFIGKRLANGLTSIGPLFALFGRYLAHRPDRLPLSDCLTLETTRIDVEATPMPRVAELLHHQFESPPAELFDAFDPPRRTTLLHQWHDAKLKDGTAVSIKLVRPEVERLIDKELDLLPVLEELSIEGGDVTPLVEDFVVWLDRQLDLSREVAGLDRLADEVGAFDAFEIPVIHRDLCGRRAVVTSRVEGTDLEETLGAPGHHRPRLARRLCQAWLQQSLLEGTCPEGPLAVNLRSISTERFAVTGGLTTSLDPRWRRHLLDAVVATGRGDPDRVCDALLDECAAAENAAKPDVVRTELRQAESFRSGGWTDEFAGRRLADTLFVYWRVLRKAGHRPKDHTVAFLRGFCELELMARALAPTTDTMADAVDDLRLVAAAVSLRKNLGPTALLRAAEELTPAIGELLEHPDRLARRLRDLEPKEEPERVGNRSRPGWWHATAGALAVVIAVSILGVTVIRAHPDLQWLEAVVAVGFVAAMLLVFRTVGRPAKE